MNKGWILLLGLLLIPLVSAVDANYNIIVEENGNSLVIIELEGKGLVKVPFQEGSGLKIKGALYTVNNNSVDVSIGSTKKAIVLYKTSLLTSKQKDVWNFRIKLADTKMNKVILAMPREVSIKETYPKAMIESSNYTKLMWEGSVDEIEVMYGFPEKAITVENIPEEESDKNVLLFPVILIAAAIVILLVFLLMRGKSNKKNVIKTLSRNESLIVNIMMANKGSIKRNKLEKMSKLAKSSLANTLNNLEKKKIIEIDKTYTTHFIKFTRWFNEL